MVCNQNIDIFNLCRDDSGSVTIKKDFSLINCAFDLSNSDCQTGICVQDEVPVFPIPDDNLIWIQTNYIDFLNDNIQYCSNFLRLENISNQYVRYQHQNQYLNQDDLTIELWFSLRSLNTDKTYLISKRRKTDFLNLKQPHGNFPDLQIYVDKFGRINIEWTNNLIPLEKTHFKLDFIINTNQIYYLVIKKPSSAYDMNGFEVRLNNNVINKILVFENLTSNQNKLFYNVDGSGTTRRWNTTTRLPSNIGSDPEVNNDGDWILGAYLECNNLPSSIGFLNTSNMDIFGFSIYKRLLTNDETKNIYEIGINQCPTKILPLTDNILFSTFNHDTGNQVIDYSFYANHAILPLTNSINVNTNTYTNCDCPCPTNIVFGWSNAELNITKTAWQSYNVYQTNCCNTLNCYSIEPVERVCELPENISRIEFEFVDNSNWFSNAEVNGFKDKGLYISFFGNCSEYSYESLPSALLFSTYLNFSDFIDGVVLYYQTLTGAWGSTTVIRNGDKIILDVDINWFRLNFGVEICDLNPKVCQVNSNINCSGTSQVYINIISTGVDITQINFGDCFIINIPPGCATDNNSLNSYISGLLPPPCDYTLPVGFMVTQLFDNTLLIELDLPANCCGKQVQITGGNGLEYLATDILCCVDSGCTQFPNYKTYTWQLDPLATIYYDTENRIGCVKIVDSLTGCTGQYPCEDGAVCTNNYTNFNDYLDAIALHIETNFNAVTSLNYGLGQITAWIPEEFCDINLEICLSGCGNDDECPPCSQCSLTFDIYIDSINTMSPTVCTTYILNNCTEVGNYLLGFTYTIDPVPATTLINMHTALTTAYPTYTFILGAGFIRCIIDCIDNCTCANSTGNYLIFACTPEIVLSINELPCSPTTPTCDCQAIYEISFHNFDPAENGVIRTFDIDILCSMVWTTIFTATITIQPTLALTLQTLRNQFAFLYPTYAWMVIGNKLRIQGSCNSFKCITGPSYVFPDITEIMMSYGGDMQFTNEFLEITEDIPCTIIPQILPFTLVNSTSCCFVTSNSVNLLDQNNMTILEPTLNPLCCPPQLGYLSIQDCCCNTLEEVILPNIICQNNFETGNAVRPFAQNIWIDATSIPSSLDRFSFRVVSNTGQVYNTTCYERRGCKSVVKICGEFTCGMDIQLKYRGEPETYCGCGDYFSKDCIEIYGEFELEKVDFINDDSLKNYSKRIYRLTTGLLSPNQFKEVFSYLSSDKLTINGVEVILSQNQTSDIEGTKHLRIDVQLEDVIQNIYEDKCNSCEKYNLRDD